MINLNCLRLKNFLSHKDTHLNLSEYEGLVLIEGKTTNGHYSSNGSGKSTILEGIVYSLTGDTLRGVGVNDVVNRNHKKDTCTTLQFEKDDVSYTIDRYRKDTSKGDSIVLSRESEDISKRVNKETQKLIEDTLGISYKVLSSTILLGEGLSSRFTQLSDPEKKSLIESTLNMNYDISAIRARANTRLTAIKLEKARSEGRLATLKELATLDISDMDHQKVLLEDQRSETMKSLEETQSSLTALRAERGSLDTKITLLRNSLSSYDSLTSELSRVDSEAARLVNELTSIESAAIPVCTLCHQPLSSDSAKESLRSEYKQRIEFLTSQMKDLQDKLNKLPNRSILESKYKELMDSVKEKDDRIADMTNSLTSMSNILGSVNASINSLQDQIAQAADLSTDITRLEHDLKDTSYQLNKYEYFYKLFSPTGIVTDILSSAIEYINERLQVYSSILLDKDYKLSSSKGKITLVDEKGASYQSLSNGEKRRLDISIQFSLHDYVHMYCGLKLNCCFIDEILDTLDDVGVDNIFDVLRLKLEYCQLKSIFIITHNGTLKDKFDRIITVVKDSTGDSYVS